MAEEDTITFLRDHIVKKGSNTTIRYFYSQCDGGIPACGNCTRAGVPCVDVDGRNAGLSIPRE